MRGPEKNLYRGNWTTVSNLIHHKQLALGGVNLEKYLGVYKLYMHTLLHSSFGGQICYAYKL